MDNPGSLKEWGAKVCPLRNKQCLQDACAWWNEVDRVCAIKKKAK